MLNLLIGNISGNKMSNQIVPLSSLSVNGKGTYGIAASAVPYAKDKYTYLRITDINDDGTLNIDDLKSVDDPDACNYVLQPNDIVCDPSCGTAGFLICAIMYKLLQHPKLLQ